MNEPALISVVIPLFNEEESLSPLYDKVRGACENLGTPFEIIFVDDGSRDGTFRILRELHQRDPRVKAIRFRKNYGQTAAMSAGFEAAQGEVIVSMDGDLQNDPADIPRLLDKMKEGFDVVCGWRKARQDRLISRRLPSVAANWIIALLTGVKIHDNGCSLKAYRAGVIKATSLYSELHRFIPAMSTLVGARIAEIVVNHHPRRFGKSKYGIGRVWRVFLDIITVKMITGFAARPALWFGLLCLPAFLTGVSLLVAAAALFFRLSEERWMLVSTAGLMLLFLAAHLLALGIIGELIVKTGDFSPGRALQAALERAETQRGRASN